MCLLDFSSPLLSTHGPQFKKEALLASRFLSFSSICVYLYCGFYLFCSSTNKTEITTQMTSRANTSFLLSALR